MSIIGMIMSFGLLVVRRLLIFTLSLFRYNINGHIHIHITDFFHIGNKTVLFMHQIGMDNEGYDSHNKAGSRRNQRFTHAAGNGKKADRRTRIKH